MIDESTMIISLYSLDPTIKIKLLNAYTTVGELIKSNAEQLLEIGGMTAFEVACVIEFLNRYNYHLAGEELFDISYFYTNSKISNRLKECDYLVSKRDMLRKNKIYKNEEKEISNMIHAILKEIEEIKTNDEHRKR
jgi:hypothetical protein